MTTAIMTQLRQEGVLIPHGGRGKGAAPGVSSWGTGKAVPLEPTGHLLYKATLPSPGDKAALHGTQKPTQGGCQNKETKKEVPYDRTV